MPRFHRRIAVPSLCATLALALSSLIAPSGRGSVPRSVLDGMGIDTSLRFASSPSLTQRALGGLGDQLAFEPNVGQADPAVRYLARGAGYTLFLTDDGATLVLPRSSPLRPGTRGTGLPSPASRVGALPRQLLPIPDDATTVVTVRVAGATARPRLVASGRLPGIRNYYIGADPRRWRTRIPTYARIAYQGVLPDADMVFYGDKAGHPEYDLVLHPGADPARVRLKVTAERIDAHGVRPFAARLNAVGDLVLRNGRGDVVLRQGHPLAYQVVGGVQCPVKARYVVDGQGRFGMAMGAYDRRRSLVVDPPLVADSNTVGGNGFAHVVDHAGRLYVTSLSETATFPPPSPHAFQRTVPRGDTTAFVSVLSPDGRTLLSSTFLSGRTTGSGGTAIALDATGNVVLAGETGAVDGPSDFPATPGSYVSNRNADLFVAKLLPDGSRLLFSAIFGGGDDAMDALAVDGAGNAYVTGSANRKGATGFPTTAGAVGRVPDPSGNAFALKLSADGRRLVYSTLLGGHDEGTGIAVDRTGHAYVVGNVTADSPPFPVTTGASRSASRVGQDAFVVELGPDGRLIYGRLLSDDRSSTSATGVALDPAGRAVVVGGVGQVSAAVPATPATYHTIGHDVYVAALAPGGAHLAYAARFGGLIPDRTSATRLTDTADEGTGVAVDGTGRLYVTGSTNTTDFPTTRRPYGAAQGGVFLVVLSPGAQAAVYSARIGGSGHLNSQGGGSAETTELVNDTGGGVVVDAVGNAYITGTDNSTDKGNFPTTPGAFQRSGGGGAVVAKFSPAGGLLYSTFFGG